MAWNKSTWQDVIGTEISKSTVTFGNSVTGVINTNLASPLKFLNLSIRCEVLFGGTPDGNAEIKVYGRDALGGDESDTIPIYRQDIEFVTSDSQIITLPNIDTSSIDSLQIEVLNKDSTDSIDVWVSFMYGYIDTVAGSSPDETVKISYNDTTKDYLENKLVGEFGVIELTVLGEAAFETYKISLNSTKLSNWDTAYGWGDHSVEGYLKSFIETDPIFSAWLAYPPSLSEFTNDVGYLTAETDPDFNSWLSGVTPANWDAAYGWGDHSVEGYLKSFIEVDPVFIAWLSYPPALSEFTNDLGYLTAETDPDFNSWLSGVTPANWDSAYGWGDHSIQGYLKSFIETDPIFAAWLSYPPSLSEFTNDLGYLTAETDPDFNSWLSGVTPANWDAAYGWGDHSIQGYLKSYIETDPVFIDWLNYPPALSEFTNDLGYLTAETDPDFNSWLGTVTPANWDASYGWGDHSIEGYLKSFTETDPIFIDWLSYPPSLSEFTNDLGYLTAETDPDFNSWLSGVTPANWDSAYGWGDHSIQGYLKSYIETDPVFIDWLSYPPSLSEFTNDLGYLTVETDPDFNSWLGTVTPANWDAAYGWGDHSIEGYLKVETDPIFIAWLSYPPSLSEFTNDMSFLTAETDPDFNSWLSGVTPANWDAAYGWGDHSIEGYLKSFTETDPIAMAINTNTKEPTGFIDRTSSIISFTDGTMEFKIDKLAPATEFKYYVNGVLYTKSAACLVNILDTEGLWYIYFNNATLTAVYNAHPGFDKALVSTIYWDATNNKGILICDERHGCTMSWSIHEYLHDTIGARFASGLALTGSIVGDGDTNSHAQVSIDNGEIFDEDLSINITDGASGLFVQDISPIAKIPVFWRSGVNGDWRMDTATDYPVKQGAARIQYNLYTGGSWSATDITSNGKYGVMWILATNDISHPIIAILGQGDYGTLLLAQNAGYSALSLGALPTAETKVIYKLIFQTSSVYANVPKARLREITDYRQTSTGPVGASVITNHNSLSGRSDASVHPSESIDTTVTNFNNILTSADTTVQKALETIDNFYQERLILAEEMQNPNNADWVVNVLAPLSADDNNNGLNVRLFDDTVNEGIGFNIFVPLFATNIVLKFKSRAITAPAGTKKVDLGLYFRTVPDNAAVDAWSAKKDITGLISIPTNEYFQYDTTTLSLATLGITSNRYVQFEIVRDAADEANDDLVGDWALLSMRVLFT